MAVTAPKAAAAAAAEGQNNKWEKVSAKKKKKKKKADDPNIPREKERFMSHFRSIVDTLLASHAPLDKGPARTREVNARVQEICAEFMKDVEAHPPPTKKITEEEYQRRLQEEEQSIAQSRARSVRFAKLRQRIELLRKEIDKQKEEQRQWEDLREMYNKKREREQLQEENESASGKKQKTEDTSDEEFLSREDKQLLRQLNLTRVNVEKATQTLSLQVDYLKGTLREIKQFDESVDHWTRNTLAAYHKQRRSEDPADPRSLIRDTTST